MVESTNDKLYLPIFDIDLRLKVNNNKNATGYI